MTLNLYGEKSSIGSKNIATKILIGPTDTSRCYPAAIANQKYGPTTGSSAPSGGDLTNLRFQWPLGCDSRRTNLRRGIPASPICLRPWFSGPEIATEGLPLIRGRIQQWRRRESNPRPKTFRTRVYILVRFRLFSSPDPKEPATWPEHQPVEFRPQPPGQPLRTILQEVTPFN
jgi:hypothetical protein